METISKEIRTYVSSSGKDYFQDWFIKLKDSRLKALIRVRLYRLAMGNPGNNRFVGEGVFELKIFFGPGIRIYCGQDGRQIIVLLCGGDKSTQNKDIERAK